MKVVHVGYKYGLSNTGGAAIAATRLHNALLERGIESHYVCVWKCEEGQNVHQLPRQSFVWRGLFSFLTKITRGVWKFTTYRHSVPLNLIPLFGFDLLLKEIKPDVIHIHWINVDVISFGQLKRLKHCKVVVNLHDLFMVNIIAPHPQRDRRYIEGVTYRNASWLERWLFNRKSRAIRACRPVFIGPSQWVKLCSQESIIGRDFPTYAISNVIDDRFRYDAQLRNRHKKFIILFGAYGGRRNPAKGFTDLNMAMSLLPKEIKEGCELWIFGEDSKEVSTGGVPTRFKGNVSAQALVNLYHMADVFAFPSKDETQGMTKVEALLCGLPVVAFDRTACAEGIVSGVSGWVAVDGDIESFAHGISYFYRKWHNNEINHSDIAEYARRMYDTDGIVKSIVKVYNGRP